MTRAEGRRHTGAELRRFAAYVVLALGVVAAAILTAMALRSADQGAGADPDGEPPLVAFLGDSYTEGSGEDSGVENRWRSIYCRERGCTGLNFGVGGSGYVQAGHDGTVFADRIDAIVSASPQMVIIAGGANDMSSDPSQRSDAADAVVGRLAAELPEAQIVLFSPFWWGQISDNVNEFRDSLRSIAENHQVHYLDVTELFVDDPEALLGEDGVHPTDEGHEHIAEYLLTELPEIPPAEADDAGR